MHKLPICWDDGKRWPLSIKQVLNSFYWSKNECILKWNSHKFCRSTNIQDSESQVVMICSSSGFEFIWNGNCCETGKWQMWHIPHWFKLTQLACEGLVGEEWGRGSRWDGKTVIKGFVPLSSCLTLWRFAGQELLTVMVGAAIPVLLYTSRRFPETGSCRRPITTD